MSRPVIVCLVATLAGAAVPAMAQVLEMSGDGRLVPSSLGSPPISIGDLCRGRPVPADVESMIVYAARRYRLSPSLVAAVAHQESAYRTRAVSSKGAIGVMQLMPQTARDLGVDPHDPQANILGGAAYLRTLIDRFDGDLVRAIAAYNAGPGAVERHGGAPDYPETQAYLAANLDQLARSAVGPIPNACLKGPSR